MDLNIQKSNKEKYFSYLKIVFIFFFLCESFGKEIFSESGIFFILAYHIPIHRLMLSFYSNLIVFRFELCLPYNTVMSVHF